MLLLADQVDATSGVWPFIAPVLQVALGALLAIVGNALILWKSEDYRKLGAWEAYGHQLWEKKYAVYSAMLNVIVKFPPKMFAVVDEYRQPGRVAALGDGSHAMNELASVLTELQDAHTIGPLVMTNEVWNEVNGLLSALTDFGRHVTTTVPCKVSIERADDLALAVWERFGTCRAAMQNSLGIPAYSAAHESSIRSLMDRHSGLATPLQ